MGVWSGKWVAVASREPEAATPIATAVREGGGQVFLLTESQFEHPDFAEVILFNPKRPESLAIALEKHRRASVHLHGAVNLVDAPASQPFLSASPLEFNNALAAELRFLRWALHGELGKMLTTGGGAIATVLGHRGEPWHEPSSLHSAITGAAEALTHAVAAEFGRVKVRANCLRVGPRKENNGTDLPEPVPRPDARRSNSRWALTLDEEIASAALGLLLPGFVSVSGQTFRLG